MLNSKSSCFLSAQWTKHFTATARCSNSSFMFITLHFKGFYCAQCSNLQLIRLTYTAVCYFKSSTYSALQDTSAPWSRAPITPSPSNVSNKKGPTCLHVVNLFVLLLPSVHNHSWMLINPSLVSVPAVDSRYLYWTEGSGLCL